MRGLDLERLERVKLHRRPWGQVLIANLGLAVDYRLPRRTEIVLEGVEHLSRPDRVFFAMNHTDRYNYWPFQYQLYRQKLGFTATWVKGKYYENRGVGAFMDAMNNIPLPSRGYVIATRFQRATRRKPTRDEYRLLRDLVDRTRSLDEPLPEGVADDLADFVGEGAAFLDSFDAAFDAMIRRVVALNRRAIFDLDLNILVFPQGTRSKRLTRGRTGLVQMAQHLGVDIVPVGCNGSDQLYPGDSPFSKGGRVVYRIGEPIRLDAPEHRALRVPSEAIPLTRDASARYEDRYQALTERVMDAIDALLDPQYRRDREAVQVNDGADRFLL